MAEDANAAADTGSAAESSPETSALDTGSAEAPETTTETADPEPELFMSPGAQTLKAQQQRAAQPAGEKKRMPGSVREKIEQQLEKDLRAKIDAERPWAANIPPDQGQSLRKLYELSETRPLYLVNELITKMAQSPLHRAEIESYLAQFFKPTQPDQDPEPQPDIPTSESHGQPVVMSFAQQKKWLEWQQRKQEATRRQELAPLQQDQQQRQQRARQHQEDATFKQGIETRVMSRPGFKEHHQAIHELYNASPRPWNTDRIPRSTREFQLLEEHLLAEAYHTVMTKQAGEAAAKKIAQDLKNKQGINGATGTGGTGASVDAKAPRTMREGMARVKAKLGVA